MKKAKEFLSLLYQNFKYVGVRILLCLLGGALGVGLAIGLGTGVMMFLDFLDSINTQFGVYAAIAMGILTFAGIMTVIVATALTICEHRDN